MPLPTITVTDLAAERIDTVRARQKLAAARVRIALRGVEAGQPDFLFDLVPPGDEGSDELVVPGPGTIEFLVAPAHRRWIDGVVVDADPFTGALTATAHLSAPTDPLVQEVEALLAEEINPAVAQHGGVISLLDIADGVAYVQMGGGCQGCGLAAVTLSQGVRTAILDRFPQLHDVVDTTDHAQGANPYYQAAKK